MFYYDSPISTFFFFDREIFSPIIQLRAVDFPLLIFPINVILIFLPYIFSVNTWKSLFVFSN